MPNAAVQVSSNTPPGTYSGSYTICLVASPATCSTAMITLTVLPTISAQADNFTLTAPQSGSLLANDTVNGAPAQLSQVTVSSPNASNALFVDTANATVQPMIVIPGTYTETYTICQVASPATCSTATITVMIP